LNIAATPGEEAADPLTHESRGIPARLLHAPGPDFVDRVFRHTDRRPTLLRNLQ